MLTLVLVLAVCSWLLLCALLLAVRAPGPSRRRGGYMDLRSRVLSYTSPRTGPAAGTYTGCKPDGLKAVASVTLAERPPLNSAFVSGFSTVGRSEPTATAGFPGSQTPPGSAA